MGSNITILKDYLNGIADAIRYRGNTTDAIKASDFKTAIRNLPVNIIYNVPTNEETGKPDEIIQVMNYYTPEYISYQNYIGSKLTLAGLRTNNITNMSNMFYNCSYITSLDVSAFNTAKVENMSNMFYGCDSLTSLNLSNFNGSNVTNMYRMFSTSRNISKINMSNFNACSLEWFGMHNNMNYSYSWSIWPNYTYNNYTYWTLQELDLSGFNGHRIPALGRMFSSQSNLHTLNLAGFNGRSLINLAGFLSGAVNLSNLNLSGFNSYNAKSHQSAFSSCKQLLNADFLIHDIHVNLSEDVFGMFSGCSNLMSFNYPTFTPNQSINFASLFSGCTNLASVNLSYINFSKCLNASSMFSGCEQLKTVDLSTLKDIQTANSNLYGLFYNCPNLTSIEYNFDVRNVSQITDMFYECRNLTTAINFANQDFGSSGISGFGRMFYNCRNITSINFSNCNGSKFSSITSYNGSNTFTYAFNNQLTNTVLDFSNFNGCNITNMNNFIAYSSVAHVNLSNFNGFKVTDLTNAFRNSSVISVNLANFAANNITKMFDMFTNCSRLESVDLTNIGTFTGNSVRNMFANCPNMRTLQGSFTTHNVNDFSGMFRNCGMDVLDLSWIDFSKVSQQGKSVTSLFQYSKANFINFGNNYLNLPINCVSLFSIFTGCSRLAEVDLSLLKHFAQNGANMISSFESCSNLSNINLAALGEFSPGISMNNIFRSCDNLATIDFGDIDCSNVRFVNNAFYNCFNLTTIKNSLYNYGKAQNGVVDDIRLSNSSELTESSVMNLVDGLYDIRAHYSRTHYIYLPSEVRNQISESNKTYAQEKGWYLY